MAVTRTTTYDGPDRTEWREEDPGVGYVGFGTDWKPGTPQANEGALHAKAEQALDANAAFLALATPTNAQVVQQVQRLTRENNALIRLLLGKLDDTAGT
jgi:hypothetical protein